MTVCLRWKVGDGAVILQYFVDLNHGNLVFMKRYECESPDPGAQIGGYKVVDLSGFKL